MSEHSSKLPVKRVEAPVIQPEIQLELTKRSAYGLVTAAIALGFLLFLTGLVLGVSVNVDSSAPETLAVLPESTPAAIVEDVPIMQPDSLALPDSVAESFDSALPLTGRDSAGPAADETRPGLGALLSAPEPASTRAAGQPTVRPVAIVSRVGEPAPALAAGPTADPGTFHLQAGAFRAPENADNLKARLTERGYIARVRVTEGSAGQPLFRVLLGEYPTESTARTAAERFQSEMGQEVYVMTSRELGP